MANTIQENYPQGTRLTRSGKIKVRTFDSSSKMVAAVAVALACITVFTFARMDFGRAELSVATEQFFHDLWLMVSTPGAAGHFEFSVVCYSVLVTFGLAAITTLGGAVVAMVLGLLAACNLSSRMVSNVIKAVMSVARAVPTILWVLVFTVSIGLGAEACVVGMLFHSVAYLVKAYSESFEEVDAGVLEALRSTGASWWQIVARAVIPEKLNEILSWTFIRFEVNFVAAVVVAGLAGSGGIGYYLFLAGNYYFNIHEIGLIVYLCLGVSVVLEVVATKLRKKYIVHK